MKYRDANAGLTSRKRPSGIDLCDTYTHQKVHTQRENIQDENLGGRQDGAHVQTKSIQRRSGLPIIMLRPNKALERVTTGTPRNPTLHRQSNTDDDNKSHSKVRETLDRFGKIFNDILLEEKKKPKEQRRRRIDLRALQIFKDEEEGLFAKARREAILGNVAGVKVGDKFCYRVELIITGLHRHLQNGIDYKGRGDNKLATSIVVSGGYADQFLKNGNVLVYHGEGSQPSARKIIPKDQKLERGNLALLNSFFRETDVRVIRGVKDSKDAKKMTVTGFIYDGLYKVEKYSWVRGTQGKMVFKFRLKRNEGQPYTIHA